MLKAILDFFRNLFSGSKKKADPPKTVKSAPKPPKVTLPPIADDEPQDGSEITPDTVVIVHNENEPVLILDVESADEPIVEVPRDEVTTSDTEVGTVQPTSKARFMWCLDNGHGKKTAGKRSPKLDDGNQLMEYEFNRDIVKRVIKALDEKGVKCFNVVPEVDTDNFLDGRVKRANQLQSDLPKIFVSIHSNAAPAPANKWCDSNICGIETWHFHGSNKGQKIASIFQKHLVSHTGLKNRHTKSQSDKQFYVLRNTNMTAILTENGFYNNKEECRKLMSEELRQKVADAHVAAILEIEENGLVG